MVVFVLFGVGWAYRNWGASDWGNKWVVMRKGIGQIWWSGPKELRVSMGSGMCIAGDHSRHGRVFGVFLGSMFILLQAVQTRAGLVMQTATDIRNRVGLARTRVSKGE